MFSKVPAWFARFQPTPSCVRSGAPRSPTRLQFGVEFLPLVQTSSDPKNITKFGWGQAQFVGAPPVRGLPVEAPASRFSVRRSVVLMPSWIELGFVLLSQGALPKC